MLHTTDLSFVTIKQASKLTFGLLESFDTKYIRTEKTLWSSLPSTYPVPVTLFLVLARFKVCLITLSPSVNLLSLFTTANLRNELKMVSP